MSGANKLRGALDSHLWQEADALLALKAAADLKDMDGVRKYADQVDHHRKAARVLAEAIRCARGERFSWEHAGVSPYDPFRVRWNKRWGSDAARVLASGLASPMGGGA